MRLPWTVASSGPQTHADQVVEDVVALDQGAVRGPVQEYAGVHLGQAQARAGHCQVAQRHVGRGDPQRAALARADDLGAAVGRAFQRERLVDDEAAGVAAGGQQQAVAGRGCRDGARQVGAGADGDVGRGGRAGQGRAQGGSGQPPRQGRAGWRMGPYADFLGCTIIWPDISMCSAWQNHWQ